MLENEKVLVSKEDLIQILHHLNLIVPSFVKIGSRFGATPKEEYDRLVSEFVRNWQIGKRLLIIRHELSKNLPYDELEKLFGDKPTWSFQNRTLPDRFLLPEETDEEAD